MRAAVLHHLGDLRVDNVDDLQAQDGELVVAVQAALTCGTDAKTVRAGHPTMPPFPFVLGHEFAGIVSSVGAGVERFHVGDRVVTANSAPCLACRACRRSEPWLCEARTFLIGGFAERITIPAPIVRLNCYELPETLPFQVAALTEPLACAVLCVERANIRIGDVVAITGAGPMGLMLSALVSDRGATVLVLDPHPERLAMATRFGASDVIVASRSSADVRAVVRLTADGRGPDHVIEAVGRPDVWELAIAMARPGATVHLFGGCARGTAISVPTERIHYDQVRLQASFHHTPRSIEAALGTLAVGRWPWSALLGPTVGLEELPRLFSSQSGNAGRPPKWVVEPGHAG